MHAMYTANGRELIGWRYLRTHDDVLSIIKCLDLLIQFGFLLDALVIVNLLPSLLIPYFAICML